MGRVMTRIRTFVVALLLGLVIGAVLAQMAESRLHTWRQARRQPPPSRG
jgi:hypothetical protein